MKNTLKIFGILLMSMYFVASCKKDEPAKVKVESIKLDKTNVSLVAGAMLQLNATVMPADAADKTVTWKSSDPTIATVNETGLVTAVKEGSANIIAVTQDGNKTDTCNFLVTAEGVPVTSVSLNEANIEKKAGETFLLVATVKPENATNQNLTWTSDNEDAATVDQDGLVTCNKQGNAKIKVTTQDGNKTAVCNVKVNPIMLEDIVLEEKYYMGTDEEKTIKITKVPANATEEVVLKWKTEDPSIATVDNTGKVTTGNILGETILTVKTADGRIMKTCKLLIQPKMTFTTAKNELKLLINAKDEDKNGVWIDLDGNGVKESSENILVFDSEETYTKTAQTIAIYGKVTRLYFGTDDGSSGLTDLDVSRNTSLTNLYCYLNQLTSLDVTKNVNLRRLICRYNQLKELDVSKNTKLEELNCYLNQLTSLDVTQNVNLKRLICGHNQLKELDVSNNTKLKYLSCFRNQLTNLDISNNTKLEKLRCDKNQLTSLDVSNNTDLVKLYCTDNPNLTCIKVSAEQKANISTSWHKDDTAIWNATGKDCAKMKEHNKYQMSLTTNNIQIKLEIKAKSEDQEYVWIDLNGNGEEDTGEQVTKFGEYVPYLKVNNPQTVTIYGKVTKLVCHTSLLKALDVSKNTELEYLSCYSNNLKKLDVSKNTKLTELWTQQNPDLTCIKVSAAQKANIPSNWHKDATQSYNTNCD